MDCDEPVDDFCDIWQDENLGIPEKIPENPNLDQFFIVFEVEKTKPILQDEDDDDDSDGETRDFGFVEVEGDTDIMTFWAPCPRSEHENLPKRSINAMLSKVGVPLHKQEFMVDKISSRADVIANADYNKGIKVLPVHVWISIVACLCVGEMDIARDDDDTKEICDNGLF